MPKDYIIDEYEEPKESSNLVDEEKRERKDEQHQNCISLLNIRKSLEQTTFSHIASCRTTTSTWKKLQDILGLILIIM